MGNCSDTVSENTLVEKRMNFYSNSFERTWKRKEKEIKEKRENKELEDIIMGGVRNSTFFYPKVPVRAGVMVCGPSSPTRSLGFWELIR